MIFSTLGALVGASSPLGILPSSQAAIPTYDDDYGPKTVEKKEKKSPPPSNKSQYYPPPVPPPSDPSLLINLISTELSTSVRSYVQAADWGGLRDYLNVPTESYLSLLLRAKSKPLVPPSNDPSGSWTDLKFALMELSDFALSKRSVFFNSQDLKEVQKMIEEGGYTEDENKKEGERLRVEAVKIVDKIKGDMVTTT